MLYSLDFRKKVIDFFSSCLSKTETASRFLISERTVDRWLKIKERNGSLLPKKALNKWKKINPEALIAYVQSYPEKTLRDYGDHFKVSNRAIGQAFKKLKITRKKRLIYIENEMKASVKYFWQILKENVRKT